MKAPEARRLVAQLLKATSLALHPSIVELQRYQLLDVVKTGAEICVWTVWTVSIWIYLKS